MRKLSIILIIAGVLVAASPLIGQWYTSWQESRMIDDWLNSEDVSGANDTSAADPAQDFEGLQNVFSQETTESGSDQRETSANSADNSGTADNSGAVTKKGNKTVAQTVLGVINIKKIKVKAPIVEGVKAVNLRAGIGHIPGTAGLGKPGNCALAGHRSYTFGKFFNRLDEMKVGDEFEIFTKTETLKYKIYEKLVVKPSDVSVLKGSRDKHVVTLITCTPIYVATHRLIVHAELTERVLKQP